MKLSACLITKNEERCLARCIESMQGIIDELIVVDTGSTDSTVEIALGFGAKIFHFQWIDDFAAARNYAIEQATGDWILFLDADEWFRAPKDALVFRRFLNKVKDPNTFALAIQLQNIDRTRPEELRERMPCLRAFRNLPACRYQRLIHEHIPVPPGMHIRFEQDLDVLLLHDGYSGDIFEDKIRRNNQLLYRALEKDPEDHLLHYYLGEAYNAIGELERALDHLMQFLEKSQGVSYANMGIRGILSAYQVAEKMDLPLARRREILGYAHRQYPEHPTTYLVQSFLEGKEQNWEESLKAGLQALKKKKSYRPTVEISTNLRDNLYPYLHCNLAHIYEMKAMPREALRHYLEALELEPTNRSAMDGLTQLLSRGDQVAYIHQIQALYPQPTREDLDFILPFLRRHRPKEAFMTFFEKRFTMTQTMDVNFYLMLSLIGRYGQAMEGFQKSYQETEQGDAYRFYLAGTAISSQDSGLLEKAAQTVDAVTARLLRAYAQKEVLTGLSEEEDSRHMSLLRHLSLTFGPTAPVLAWADMNGDPRAPAQIGHLFYQQRLWEAAMLYFQRAMDQLAPEQEAKSDYARPLCLCHYHLGNRKEAEGFLKLAREHGEAQGELESFRLWISQMK